MAKVTITVEDKEPSEDDEGNITLTIGFEPEIDMTEKTPATPAQHFAMTLMRAAREDIDDDCDI